MAGFADAFKKVFEKLATFFDIIDLSFFVAGSLAFAAIAMHVDHRERSMDGEYLETVASSASDIAAATLTVAHAGSDIERAKVRIDAAREALFSGAASKLRGAELEAAIKHLERSRAQAIRAARTLATAEVRAPAGRTSFLETIVEDGKTPSPSSGSTCSASSVSRSDALFGSQCDGWPGSFLGPGGRTRDSRPV